MPEVSAEFVMTTHGEERFVSRIPCHPSKRMKVLRKAWASKETSLIQRWREYNRREINEASGIHLRSFLGYVFVFRTMLGADGNTIQKVLLTCYNPREPWDKNAQKKSP